MPNAQDVQRRLVGTWHLVKWEAHNPDGSITYPLGREVQGQIMYGDDGRMSVQLMRTDQRRFANDYWGCATSAEKAEAWGNYFGYFGTYAIDPDAEVVTHQLEGSWFPNLVGTAQRRHYEFEGDQLVLGADTPWAKFRIVWDKRTRAETQFE